MKYILEPPHTTEHNAQVYDTETRVVTWVHPPRQSVKNVGLDVEEDHRWQPIEEIKMSGTHKTRDFHIRQVLSAGIGNLFCSMDQLYEVMNYLTNDNLFTHQLPRALDECRPWMHRWFAWLKDAEEHWLQMNHVNSESGQMIEDFLNTCETRFGKTHSLEQIPRDDHERKHPIQEADEMFGPDRVIALNVKETEE